MARSMVLREVTDKAKKARSLEKFRVETTHIHVRNKGSGAEEDV